MFSFSDRKKFLIGFGLAAVLLFICSPKIKSKPKDKDERIIVYGTHGCGWTKKQLKNLRDKKVPHVFHDCDTKGCPRFVKGYPTIQKKNGEIVVGYSEF